jgi:putative ABC transport system permease protein
VARQLFGVNTYTYLLMPENYDPANFDTISATFYQRYMETLARERTNRAWSAWLQPLAQIHLGPTLLDDQPTGNRYYLYGFASVAIFILLIACINYMNLATAGFAKRGRDTAIRKILGAERSLLALQFLGEALVLALVSVCLGFLIVELAINEGSIGALFGKTLAFNLADQPGLVWMTLAGSIVLGLLSGLYPAAYLSSLRPLVALVANRKHKPAKIELRLRECLLLLQFTLSIAVIACTLLMLSQMHFLADQPLGFNKDNQLLLTLRDPQMVAQIPVLQNELLQDPQVLGVTYSTSMMGQDFSVNSTSIETDAGTMEAVQMGHMAVAGNFVDVLGIQLAEGRNFSSEISTDAASAVLVNQALVDYMGWDQPIGKAMESVWGTRATVIGVVKNFNFKSLHTGVEPFFLYQPEFSTPGRMGSERELVINIAGDRVSETLAFIESTMKRFAPDEPFAYKFLDDALDELYLSEQRLMYLIGIFAGICIVITSLGLFGLTTFTTEQRTKEIGVRKVLGATRLQVVLLIFSRTMVLTLVATVIAAAVVYPVMNIWLASFAYRITISPMVFVLSASGVLLITYGTVAIQTLRIANLQPVHTLRYE